MARRQCPRSPRAEDGFHIFTWLQRKSRAGCFVSWGTRGNLHSGVPTWSFVGVACLRVTRGGVQRLRQRRSRVSPCAAWRLRVSLCAAWRLPGSSNDGCWASGGPGSSPGQRWRLQALTRVPAGLLFRASVFVLRGAPAARSVPAVCVHGASLQAGVGPDLPRHLRAEGTRGRAAAYGAAQTRGGHPASEPRSGPVGGGGRAAPLLRAPAADGPGLCSLHAVPSARGSLPAPACPSAGPLLSPFARCGSNCIPPKQRAGVSAPWNLQMGPNSDRGSWQR